MKNSYNYAAMLRYLITFTQVKLIQVAKVVDYDVSYISKWCNNNFVPPAKNIESINNHLAELFAKEIKSQDTYSKLLSSFHIPSTEIMSSDMHKIKGVVFKLLMDSFESTNKKVLLNGSKKLNEEKRNDSSSIMIDKNEIIDCLRELVRSIVENAETDIELIFSIDICKILQKINLDHIEDYNIKNIRVHCYLGVDMEELEKDPYTNIKALYEFLSGMISCEITLYDNKNFDNYNVLAIKNKLAYVFCVDSDGMMEIASAIKDIDSINKIYNIVRSKIKSRDVLMKPEDSFSLEKGEFRTKFYSATEFNFLSCNGFEFLLPFDVIETNIIKEAEKYNSTRDLGLFIRKIQVTWEERFNKAKINFFIPKSTVLEYIEKGEIYYTEINYKLSIEQRQRHVMNIIECMKKNPNISLIIVDDDLLPFTESVFNISIFYNKNSVFLKKTGHLIKNKSPWYYVIINGKIIRYLDSVFSKLAEENFCKLYTADDVERLVHKNEKMILKMLKLKSLHNQPACVNED